MKHDQTTDYGRTVKVPVDRIHEIFLPNSFIIALSEAGALLLMSTHQKRAPDVNACRLVSL